MTPDTSDIPTHWDDETDDRLKCTHSIANVGVEIRGISGGDMVVHEGGKFSRGDDTKWDVVTFHGERELKHGERKDTEAEAEEIAMDFMREFDENYGGKAHEAYIETLESR